jgi:pseudouridine-5'-phosphate glycosidase
VSAAELRTDAVIVACAISAGIHAALAPEHFRETTAAGVGFVASALLLAALAVVLTHRPSEATFAATVLLAGLIGSYALAVTTGIPGVHPGVDSVDGLALATKAVEAAGFVLAAAGPRLAPLHLGLTNPKGTLT